MKSDEIKWNERYKKGDYPSEPHEAVVTHFSLAKLGKALDIAAGNGRNSIFLAKNGFQVDAIDISSAGLGQIRMQEPSINIIQADLDQYQLQENKYDLIVNTNFLQRRLFPMIESGLKDLGLLIFQTFMDPRLTGAFYDPEKAERYLQPNELLQAFPSLKVIFYNEKEVAFSNGERLKAAILVARK